ncbi:MAG: hypothetical protein JWM11_7990 [Planctomycetaceae bacterium]|nr:hypothetical protein [Planctomycetaceae bacterium]
MLQITEIKCRLTTPLPGDKQFATAAVSRLYLCHFWSRTEGTESQIPSQFLAGVNRQ